MLCLVACARGQAAPTSNIEEAVEAKLSQKRAVKSTIEAGIKQGTATQPSPTPTPNAFFYYLKGDIFLKDGKYQPAADEARACSHDSKYC